MTDLVVPARHCGPARSGNGGWTAGALVGLLDPDHDRSAGWPAVRVTLRRPPPLDVPMAVADGVASDGQGVVAVAEEVDGEPASVAPVDAVTASAAEASYAGVRSHPFPTCFVCGPAREPGDGLRIFPGRVADDDERVRVAATWTPHPSVAEDALFRRNERSERLEGHAHVDDHARASLATTWAALDCVGGWAGDLTDRPMVLGRITARVHTLPLIGAPHVVVGGGRGRDGRKTYTASTLYDAEDRVVAVAEHVWIAVDPEAFGQLGR